MNAVSHLSSTATSNTSLAAALTAATIIDTIAVVGSELTPLAMISAMRSNDGYLDELASNAVDFGNQLSQMLGNELVSASKRDNALLSAMN